MLRRGKKLAAAAAAGALGCGSAVNCSSGRVAPGNDADNLLTSAMMANQSKLPRLPLPSLDDSLARYLKAVEPLVAPDQFAATKRYVSEALAAASVLRKLQEKLEASDSAGVDLSFISAAWEEMYLGLRCSLALNVNPAAVVSTASFGADATTQVARAARLVAAHVAFGAQVESGTLAPDVMRGTPLDMRQYPKMFSATRLPRLGRDVHYKAPPGKSTHIVVLRGNTFWRVEVLDAKTGAPLSVSALETALQKVVDATPMSKPPGPLTSGSAPSLAVLTTADRDTWARLRADLESHTSANRRSLAAIDDALFHLCLDEASVGTTGGAEPQDEALVAAERLALCGDARTAPRWFDKSFTLAVTADGACLLNFEHSWGDGICVARAGAETFRIIKKNAFPTASPRESAPPPVLLELALPASVKSAVEQQDKEFAATCAALDLDILTFTKFGAAQIKSWGVSPDGAQQAALALAFFR